MNCVELGKELQDRIGHMRHFRQINRTETGGVELKETPNETFWGYVAVAALDILKHEKLAEDLGKFRRSHKSLRIKLRDSLAEEARLRNDDGDLDY